MGPVRGPVAEGPPQSVVAVFAEGPTGYRPVAVWSTMGPVWVG